MQRRWGDQNNNQVQMALQAVAAESCQSNVGHLLSIKIILKQNLL